MGFRDGRTRSATVPMPAPRPGRGPHRRLLTAPFERGDPEHVTAHPAPTYGGQALVEGVLIRAEVDGRSRCVPHPARFTLTTASWRRRAARGGSPFLRGLRALGTQPRLGMRPWPTPRPWPRRARSGRSRPCHAWPAAISLVIGLLFLLSHPAVADRARPVERANPAAAPVRGPLIKGTAGGLRGGCHVTAALSTDLQLPRRRAHGHRLCRGR